MMRSGSKSIYETGSNNRRAARMGMWLGLLSAAGPLAIAAAEDSVTLTDGTTISARVLQKEQESILLEVPRNRVAAINGEALPMAVTQGNPAPGFTAVDLAGTTHTLSDPSVKVTLLKFWASWCPYCRADVPLMKALHAKYRDEGLRILAISVDQDPEKLRSFVAKEQLTYPVIATASGVSSEQQAIPQRYETRGIPAYFIIANGIISQSIPGSISSGQQDLDTPLKQLLGLAN